MKQHIEHVLLLHWLIFTGALLFALFVFWDQGWLLLLVQSDKSKISWVICLIYLLVTIHCAVRILVVSRQLNISAQIAAMIHRHSALSVTLVDGKVQLNGSEILPDSMMAHYLRDLFGSMRKPAEQEGGEIVSNTDLLTVLETQLKGPHEIGWFLIDVMLKLGLLGTMIGFIFMLGAVSNIADFDITTMQNILQHMSSGMGTALYTTMVGLIASILAATQYHMLDSGADDLLERVRQLTYAHILPKLS